VVGRGGEGKKDCEWKSEEKKRGESRRGRKEGKRSEIHWQGSSYSLLVDQM